MGISGAYTLYRRGYSINQIGALHYDLDKLGYDISVSARGKIASFRGGSAVSPNATSHLIRRYGINVVREGGDLVLQAPAWTPYRDVETEFATPSPLQRQPGETYKVNPFTAVAIGSKTGGITLRPLNAMQAMQLKSMPIRVTNPQYLTQESLRRLNIFGTGTAGAVTPIHPLQPSGAINLGIGVSPRAKTSPTALSPKQTGIKSRGLSESINSRLRKLFGGGLFE